MKNLRKIAGYIFPHENGGIPLALLALAATASSCGVVAIWAMGRAFPARTVAGGRDAT
jgi:DUF917 family protein